MEKAWTWWEANYVSMQGRINRKLFWGRFLLLWLLVLPLNGFYIYFDRVLNANSVSYFLLQILAFFFFIFLILGIASIFARRLNDLNIDGKTVAILCIFFALAVLVSFGIMSADDPFMERKLDEGIRGANSIILLTCIVFGSGRGTKGPNWYGHDPLVPDGAQMVEIDNHWKIDVKKAWVWWMANYVNMQGRINRNRFWVLCFLLMFYCALPFPFIIPLTLFLHESPGGLGLILSLLALPLLAFLLGYVSLVAQRFNDFNIKGAFISPLIVVVVCVSSYFFPFVIGFLIHFFTIIFSSFRGTKGQNQYGHDLLDEDEGYVIKKALILWKDNYISMQGCINRQLFSALSALLFFLGFNPIVFLIIAVEGDKISFLRPELSFWYPILILGFILASVILFAIFWGSVSLIIRRLNDIGISGTLLRSVILFFVGIFFPAVILFFSLPFIFSLFPVIALCAWPGMKVSSQYGTRSPAKNE